MPVGADASPAGSTRLSPSGVSLSEFTESSLPDYPAHRVSQQCLVIRQHANGHDAPHVAVRIGSGISNFFIDRKPSKWRRASSESLDGSPPVSSRPRSHGSGGNGL